MRPAPRRFPIIHLPSRRLLVSAALALVAGLLVHQSISEAAATTARFGPTTEVAVLRRDVAAGERLRPGDVGYESRPAAHLPSGAVGRTTAGELLGRRASTDLAAGEVLVASRLVGGDGSAVSAVLPEGWRAVAVPILDSPLPVAVGDRVEVVATFDPTLTARPSRLLVADALVVAVDDDAVTVAMPAADVTDVAFALVNGVVLLALVG